MVYGKEVTVVELVVVVVAVSATPLLVAGLVYSSMTSWLKEE
jgi:hypothetical protein